MNEPIVIVDLFAGAGGFSTGAIQALEEHGLQLGRDVELHAINHWGPAVDTHRENHTNAYHYQNGIDELYPPDVVDGKDVDLLIAGPTCTHFSVARGGQPINEQKREPAWNILNWIQLLEPEHVIIENVGELRSWGPSNEDGQPTKDGSIFETWINAFEAYGYTIIHDDRGRPGVVLTAADYGDPTSRDRLFIIGSKSTSPTIPPQTHGEPPVDDLEPWVTATEIIDTEDTGESIWTRNRPLVNNTMKRIADGIRRYAADELQPFVDALEELGSSRDLKNGKDVRLVEDLQADSVQVDDLENALETREEPFLVHGPAIVPANQNGTETMIMGQQSDARALDADSNPVPTIAKRGAIHRLESTAFVLPRNGSQRDIYSNPAYAPDEKPLHTVTAKNTDGHLVSAFLLDYHGNSTAASLEEPIGTLRTKDRFALCVPELYPWGLDIHYRLLNEHELKLAQGFPADYTICGDTKRDRIEQIGNAVPVGLGRALVAHALEDRTPSLSSFGGGLTGEADASHPEYEEVLSDD